jgi:hypothetical protein
VLREAQDHDCEPIATKLREAWQQLALRQIASGPRPIPALETLAEQIRSDLHDPAAKDRWYVSDGSNPTRPGFFALAFEQWNGRRWKIPAGSLHVKHMAWVDTGEILLPQFIDLLAHFDNISVLITIPRPLQGICWAAIKSGFQILGESPTIVGTYLWLVADRSEKFDVMQAALRKARIIRD